MITEITSLTVAEAALLQKRLAKKVITKNILPKKTTRICGVDASYKNGIAYCAAVVVDKSTINVIESVKTTLGIKTPYIPGLFMLREAKPILKTLKKLTKRFDVLLVDGHGLLHPRQCGLACYIGLMLDKPVIGVAKKLLCGHIRTDSRVEYQGKILGYKIKRNKKTIFVSVGHKINLKTAVSIVKELTFEQQWQPEPLRLADIYSKKDRHKDSRESFVKS